VAVFSSPKYFGTSSDRCLEPGQVGLFESFSDHLSKSVIVPKTMYHSLQTFPSERIISARNVACYLPLEIVTLRHACRTVDSRWGSVTSVVNSQLQPIYGTHSHASSGRSKGKYAPRMRNNYPLLMSNLGVGYAWEAWLPLAVLAPSLSYTLVWRC
jgi:hypothetical protein